MQALHSFISPVPGFDSDIPVLSIPVLARPHGDESMSDPSTGASASALMTRAGKWKATTNPSPQRKARKTIGRSTCRIKINDPAPKAPSLTPPSGPRRKILIQRLKRYTHDEYVSSLTIFLFMSLCVECPNTSTQTPLRGVLRPVASP
jgi:hypothetical protein